MFDNMKIGTKLTLSILLVVFVVLAIIGGISINAYRNSLIDNSKDIMQARLDNVAEAINRENVQTGSVVMSMADTQQTAAFGDRQFALDYTREVLLAFPNFVGTYINYEPNADGNDAEWASDPDCCTDGRFLAYWYWNDGVLRDEILLAPTVELDGSPWYDGARNLFAQVGPGNSDASRYLNITDPFVYEGVPMVSATYPIEKNGEFVGIAGIDRSLAQMYEIVQEFKPYDTAEIYVISQAGGFVTTSHDEDPFAGQMVSDNAGFASLFKPFVESREPGVIDAQSPDNGNQVFYSFSPVETGEWTVVMEVNRQEILAPVNQTITIVALVSLIGFAAIAAAVWQLTRLNVLRPIAQFTEIFGEIGTGNYETRVAITSQDEFGEMAGSLNTMLDNTTSLIQGEEERNRIQGSIMNLLNEVSDVADGDLTIQATVNEDITGAIADSLNFMTENLHEVISQVQRTALNVNSAANEIQVSAEQLAQGSELQASQIVDTSAAVDEMAVSIQQVSENSALSATVGEQARVNAQRGGEAVRNTIEGMNRIRTQVQNTSKRIKRLGEGTQEIDEMLQLIRTITKRTSILALNASIQASRAGEAGRSFMVVAEEVEQLAERSADAAKQIESLVKNIQVETNEAVAAMEATTHEVVVGSQLANEAGSRLNEIESVSERLSELIQGISRASQQQARGSESIAKSMSDIAEVTKQTTTGTRDTTVSIRSLAEQAEELRSAVSSFKLDAAVA